MKLIVDDSIIFVFLHCFFSGLSNAEARKEVLIEWRLLDACFLTRWNFASF